MAEMTRKELVLSWLPRPRSQAAGQNVRRE